MYCNIFEPSPAGLALKDFALGVGVGGTRSTAEPVLCDESL